MREQHRRQPLLGARGRGIQIPGLRLHLHQMVIVRHQQNGVARGHPEQGAKPTIAPRVSVPPVKAVAATPPISVLGKESSTRSTCLGCPIQRQQQHDEQKAG